MTLRDAQGEAGASSWRPNADTRTPLSRGHGIISLLQISGAITPIAQTPRTTLVFMSFARPVTHEVCHRKCTHVRSEAEEPPSLIAVVTPHGRDGGLVVRSFVLGELDRLGLDPLVFRENGDDRRLLCSRQVIRVLVGLGREYVDLAVSELCVRGNYRVEACDRDEANGREVRQHLLHESRPVLLLGLLDEIEGDLFGLLEVAAPEEHDDRDNELVGPVDARGFRLVAPRLSTELDLGLLERLDLAADTCQEREERPDGRTFRRLRTGVLDELEVGHVLDLLLDSRLDLRFGDARLVHEAVHHLPRHHHEGGVVRVRVDLRLGCGLHDGLGDRRRLARVALRDFLAPRLATGG